MYRTGSHSPRERYASSSMILKQAKATLIPIGLYWAYMMLTLLLFVLLSRTALAFHLPAPRKGLATTSQLASHRRSSTKSFTSSKLFLASNNDDASSLTVKASELDDAMGLSEYERTVVNVHRVCSPSVVYVTSVLKSSSSSTTSGRSSRSRRWQRSRNKANTDAPKEDVDDNEQSTPKLPRGTELGSGSGFVIDANGYLITNYHVIQRAYETNQAMLRYESFWDGLAKNATQRVKNSLGGGNSEVVDNMESIINGTINAFSGRDTLPLNSSSLPAQVFVRFGTNGDGGDGSTGGGSSSSSALYHPCEIVDVAKELDVAVLKLCTKPLPSLKALQYGSSSNLLVGQSLVAIGNPFGLDRTVTSGLVSALGRSVTGVAGNDIKNCIQTDAAINPGNSGGPLLNLKQEVVGVNTMIITTSGSSAGIGFAVPGDSIKESSNKIIELDKELQLRKAKRKGRGWLGVNVALGAFEESLKKRLPASAGKEGVVGAFVTSIAANSPLVQDKSKATLDTTSVVNGMGDRIINVGGNDVASGDDFASEMKQRVDGEQLSLTVQDKFGEKRVMYVTLSSLPL